MITTARKGEWMEIIVPKEWQGLTTEDIFFHIWGASKKQVHLLRMNKEVRVNRRPAVWTKKLQTNDRLELRIFKEEKHDIAPVYMELDVIYEDDHLIVVNKPAGLDTHPNVPEETNTLANGVAFYLQAKGENGKLKHIHRLDRGTSGAVLFAKHSFAGAILDKMLQKREIERLYWTVVHGVLKNNRGKIDRPIGRDRHHPTRRRISSTGVPAVTFYETVRRMPDKAMTAVVCKLETGRTHQIRVHFSSLGHPVVGDTLYGGRGTSKHLALHAVQISFRHPFTMEMIVCNADPPADFKKLFFEG